MDILNRIYSASIYGRSPLFTQVTEILSEESLLKYILHVEGVLAKTQGELGIIPQESAVFIFKLSQTNFINLPELLEKTATVGFPIVGVVSQINQKAGPHAKYVHWGATTQDIMDTALMLQLKEVLQLLEKELASINKTLALLISQHRHTIMVGRSQMQHGLPITFGFKAALWLSPLLEHQIQIKHLLKHSLALQFGGALGTLASIHNGLELRKKLAIELALNEPKISWHSSREKLVDIMHRISSLTGSLGKIGVDISLMSQTEIREVSEPFIPGRGTSSTMPQKRNPISAQALIVSAKNTSKSMHLMYESLLNDHERGPGIWQLEWLAIPDLLLHATGGIGVSTTLLQNLEIFPDKMKENLMLTHGFVMAESVMMQLAKTMGKQEAHDYVHQLIELAQKQNKNFQEILFEDDLAKQFGKEEIKNWLDPTKYLGESDAMIDLVLAQAYTTS